VSSGRIGNPALKAERAWNAEIGMDYNFSSRFRISTGFFYRDHQDLIDWANTSYANMPRKDNLVPGGNYALARNVEFIRTSGLELDIMYNEKTGPNSQLLAMAGLTWLKSVNDDPVPSLYISSHARFLLNYSVAWTVKRFSFSVAGLYKERAEQVSTPLNTKLTPSYFLMNVKAGWQFIPVKGRLFLQADNLFNTTYSDLLGAQMPGRWLSGGIEIAL
jgi:iron complex outermembrane receptor protein